MNALGYIESARKLKTNLEEMLTFLQQETASKDRIEWDLNALNKQRGDLQLEIENIKSNIKRAKDDAENIKKEAHKKAAEIEESARRKTIDAATELNKIREEVAKLEKERYKLKDE